MRSIPGRNGTLVLAPELHTASKNLATFVRNFEWLTALGPRCSIMIDYFIRIRNGGCIRILNPIMLFINSQSPEMVRSYEFYRARTSH